MYWRLAIVALGILEALFFMQITMKLMFSVSRVSERGDRGPWPCILKALHFENFSKKGCFLS